MHPKPILGVILGIWELNFAAYCSEFVIANPQQLLVHDPISPPSPAR